LKQNLGKDTYETLKKLKVVSERAQKEVDREEKAEDSQPDESDYWEENDRECDLDKEISVSDHPHNIFLVGAHQGR
jgi:hypothetical protein